MRPYLILAYPLLILGAGTALPCPAAAQATLTARDSAVHAINRLAWGATPGLVDRVAREGVMRWIDRQIAVESPGDPGLRDVERRFGILDYSSEDMLRTFTEARRERRARQGARRDSAGMTPERRRTAEGMNELRALGGQLQQLAVVRAAQSEHQLAEVMADFWTNHFNVFYGKNLDRAYLPGYIERTIRPRALGRFDELLIATAQSPAMLIYLDNAQSVTPGARPPALDRMRAGARGRPMGRRNPRADSMLRAVEQRLPTGLNENYARELLELHTLGVDGGYIQQDVVEVARILTGWSVERPFQGGGYVFNSWAHDYGAKTVLGVAFPAGKGEDEGVRLLRLLASHPSTMHYVSGKLCARFVRDEPPDGCTDDAVRAWRRSGGDIREVLRAIVRSPDFWAATSVSAKIKTPLEFMVSAVRAVGGTPDTTPRLAGAVGRLGQPLYLQTAPTGYPETQEDWVNSGALLQRMNLAVALAANRLPGVTVDLESVLPTGGDHAALVTAVDRVVLSGRMSSQTRRVILEQLAEVRDPVQARALAVGLALGGPEFQRQ